MSEEAKNVTGACLCGKVSFEATLKSAIGACHCGMCRRWCSGPMMSAQVEGSVKFSGEENVSRYPSSEWAERGFCKQCGSSLFYRLLPREGAPDGEYILAAGAIAEQNALAFDHEVYIDHAPGWYAFADESQRKRMTEKELLALYGVEV